jgi:hypothetical protein
VGQFTERTSHNADLDGKTVCRGELLPSLAYGFLECETLFVRRRWS